MFTYHVRFSESVLSERLESTRVPGLLWFPGLPSLSHKLRLASLCPLPVLVKLFATSYGQRAEEREKMLWQGKLFYPPSSGCSEVSTNGHTTQVLQ